MPRKGLKLFCDKDFETMAHTSIRLSTGRYSIISEDRQAFLVVRGDKTSDTGDRREWHLFDGLDADADDWIEVYPSKLHATMAALRIAARRELDSAP